MNVPDTRVGSSEGGIEPGVVEPVCMDFVEAQGDVHGGGTGFGMLPAQIVEQLVGGNGQIPDPALQEVAGERGFRCNDQVRRLGPMAHFPKQRAYPAEILLVRTLVGRYLGYGRWKHVLTRTG